MTMTATYVRQFGADELNRCYGVAVDPSDGDVIVLANNAYTSPEIRRYTADGTPVSTTALAAFEEYSGIAVNASGTTLWVTVNSGDASQPRLEQRSATGTLQAGYFGEAFPDSEIEGAADVQVGPDGKVYVVSNYYTLATDPAVYKQKVVRLATDGTVEATIGTNAVEDPVTGFPAAQTPGELAYPVGVAIDAAGNVYVSDVYEAYKCIQKFAPDGTPLLSFGGPGTGPGQFSTATYATWHQDGMKLALNADGRLFATDRYGDRVNVFATDGTFLLAFGAADSGGAMADPVAVACGSGGNVYVTNAAGGVTQWLVEEGAPEFMIRGVSVVVCGDTDC